ncbi:hypothetical protein AURDEDRAFT_176630 [Auricularia subglabra TFB-10046 SS5]|uniref:Uncharacterized protein n=1 Tax=Auricularia subglabra (strain TFB-10046 / SS5) TaxID=717982 RepID=J0WQY2_AURST|nr:hypothetical protein AURDEDRAFT_176630 [Auricularia subglabra TFB-10046 SS5]
MPDDYQLQLPSSLMEGDVYAIGEVFEQLRKLEHTLREEKAHEAAKARHYGSLERVRATVDEWAAYYRLVYERLLLLDLAIASYLRELTNSDLRDLTIRGAQKMSGRKSVSWIWGKVGDDDEVPENELESWAEEVQMVE